MLPGFIVNNVYPALASGKISSDVKAFLNKQPSSVCDMLKRESKTFKPDSPNFDRVDLEYFPSKHRGITHCRPSSKRYKQPMMFACPHCNGRLFRGMNSCGWCGEFVFSENIVPDDVTDPLLVSMLDYIMGVKPTVASVFPKRKLGINDQIVEISEMDVSRELPGIKQFIPASVIETNNIAIPLPAMTVGSATCDMSLNTFDNSIVAATSEKVFAKAIAKAFKLLLAKADYAGPRFETYAKNNRSGKFRFQATIPLSNFIKQGGLNA